jgi:hypothetical protein
MCTDDQHQEKLTLLQQIKNRLDTRNNIDDTPLVSTVRPLVIDFKDRKHLFIWSANAITFSLEDLGQIAITANTWTNISFQQGMRLVPASQTTPVSVFVRATDETIP